MRALVRVAALAGLFAGSLVSTGVAAHAAPPLPTEVDVRWDTTPQRLLVQWQAEGTVDTSEVGVFFPDGSRQNESPIHVYGPAREAHIDMSGFPGKKVLRLGVRVQDNTGWSDWAFTPEFDTDYAPIPVLAGVSRTGMGLTATWQPGSHQDGTPGDPLDRDNPPVYVPFAMDATGYYREGTPTTGRSGTVPNFLPVDTSPTGFYVGVITRNEWGAHNGTIDDFIWAARTAARNPSLPARVAYSQPTVITGLVKRYTLLPGSVTTTNDPNSLVILQGRANASSAWYTVGSTRSDGTGRYRFSVPAPGTRQYRLVTPDVSGRNPTFGFSDTARTTVTTYRLLSARFLDSTASYGQKVTAYVRLSPAAAPRATLQRWTGSAWTGVKYVQLSQGSGSYTFTAVRRGTTAYRFVVPNTTYAGRPIAGITTTTFYLTTR